MTFPQWSGFLTWADLLEHVDRRSALYYQAPLDLHPRRVTITRKFKNGKLRVCTGTMYFTANSAHLSSFRWKPKADSWHVPECPK